VAPPAIGGWVGGPGSQAALEDAQAGAAQGEAADEQQRQRGGVAEAALAVVERGHGLLGDLKAVREHVDEQEDEDPDREHGQRDACARAEQLEASDRQSEVDGEAGQRSEQHGLRKGHGQLSAVVLGHPKNGRDRIT
jgi:uncharacterized Ntn-hydrolase superfamily protein